MQEMIRFLEILGDSFLIPELGIRLAKLAQHFIQPHELERGAMPSRFHVFAGQSLDRVARMVHVLGCQVFPDTKPLELLRFRRSFHLPTYANKSAKSDDFG